MNFCELLNQVLQDDSSTQNNTKLPEKNKYLLAKTETSVPQEYTNFLPKPIQILNNNKSLLSMSTYNVAILSEGCALVEWLSNTIVLKDIIEELSLSTVQNTSSVLHKETLLQEFCVSQIQSDSSYLQSMYVVHTYVHIHNDNIIYNNHTDLKNYANYTHLY